MEANAKNGEDRKQRRRRKLLHRHYFPNLDSDIQHAYAIQRQFNPLLLNEATTATTASLVFYSRQ